MFADTSGMIVAFALDLQRQDPILFFDEVPLFEDELHDNGMSILSVKLVGSEKQRKRAFLHFLLN